MGRMSKHKAGKAAVTKRRKKSSSSASSTTISTSSSSSSGARRTPVTLAESVAIANASIGGASPTGSVSTAGSSTPSSSSSAKECEQCGNPTMLDGVSASRVWATSKKQLAPNGCQICDFVTFRKSQRPCVHCERAACEHFCEWCGNGLHTKCARARDEKVNAPNGFCCRKCEAEQADDEDEKDPEAEELGSRCGSCRLPFNATGKDAESDADSDADDDDDDERAKAPEESGFKVNQSVLVENEEVLYNAVITEVDLAGERIKIHFIRWSKSFDNWYAMDDERINESLACDCCNRWFHIGCLPPIKSSGRFKDTTYVCPTCIDDAKHFHNGTRAKAKSAPSKASMRKSSVSEDAPPAVPSKRKSAKPIVTSDDEQEAKKPSAVKKKRKLSNASDSPMKKKPELSRAASRSRSKSPDAPTHAHGSATAVNGDNDEDEDDEVMDEDRPSARATNKSAQSSPAQSPSRVAPAATGATDRGADEEGEDATAAASSPVASPRSTEAADASSSIAKPRESKDKSDPPSPSTDARADANEAQTKADKPSAPPTGAARRKLSSHSVSSLLNSASPNEKPTTPPLHPTMSSFSMLDENRRNLTSSFDVLVKTERSHQLPPLPSASTTSSSSSSSGRSSSSASFKASSSGSAKLEPFTNSSNWSVRAPPASSSSMKPSSGRGSLSAFDILREVATQSIGGELDAVTTAPAVKPKKERQRASAAKAKALKAEKAAAAAAEKAAAAAAKSQSPNGAAPGAMSEQERLAKERLQISNSFVDLHFSIRKEMYLKFCLLEEQGLLDRDTAQRLRSLIYPTSDKFQDLKFVYLVNKDLSPLYLTKRLLEVVPAALGGTGVATPQHHAPGASTPGGDANSVASSPASTTNHTAQPLPTIVPPGLTIPSFSEIIASEKAAALLHQQQQRQHQQLQQHLQQQHQTLQAAALATSGGLELCKKAAAAAAVRPDVLAKELAPLPSSLSLPSSTSSSVVTPSSSSSSLAPPVQSKH